MNDQQQVTTVLYRIIVNINRICGSEIPFKAIAKAEIIPDCVNTICHFLNFEPLFEVYNSSNI